MKRNSDLVCSLCTAGITPVVRGFSAVILNKVLAVALGVSGFALAGQFLNAWTLLQLLSNGASQDGVTHAIASDPSQNPVRIRVALWFAGIISFLVCLIVFMGAEYWSLLLFDQPLYARSLRWVALSLPFVSLLLTVQGIWNGQRLLLPIALCQNGLAVIPLLLIGFYSEQTLAWVMLAYALTPVILVLLLFPWLRHLLPSLRLKIRVSWSQNQAMLKTLASFSLMTLPTALVSLLCLLWIRSRLGTQNWDLSGQWHAIYRFWDLLVVVVGGFLNLWLLPLLSRQPNHRHQTVRQSMLVLLAGMLVLLPVMLWARQWAFPLLFSKSFVAETSPFLLQGINTTLRLAVWPVVYLLMVEHRWKQVLLAELTGGFIWMAAGWICIERWGVLGAVVSQTFELVIYAFLMILFSLQIRQESSHD